MRLVQLLVPRNGIPNACKYKIYFAEQNQLFSPLGKNTKINTMREDRTYKSWTLSIRDTIILQEA